MKSKVKQAKKSAPAEMVLVSIGQVLGYMTGKYEESNPLFHPPSFCGDCGKKLTEVRPGKHQCDNRKCSVNKISNVK